MARSAGRLERALMRILMAVLALAEWDARVADSHLAVADGFRFVALGAEHLFVRPVQAVLGRRVIEVSDILPFRNHMAAFAVSAHLSTMLVLMTTRALCR